MGGVLMTRYLRTIGMTVMAVTGYLGGWRTEAETRARINEARAMTGRAPMTGNPGTGGESTPRPERFHRDCNHCGHDFGHDFGHASPGTRPGDTPCMDCQPPGRVFCTDPSHRPGQHNAECLPPADPADPELRLMRAIFGLCGLCKETEPHEHDPGETAGDYLKRHRRR